MKRLCLEPTCAEQAVYRGRCKAHARERERGTYRGRIYRRKRWLVLRHRQLALEPLCRCGEIATDVDHIVPIRQGEAWAPAEGEGRR